MIITCKNCGWSWNKKDGGDNPCKCHKCGYNNKDMYGKKIVGLGGVTRRTKTIDSTKVETKEGTIFFSIINVYEDGKLFDVRFTKEDNRDTTYIGRYYYRYGNKQSYDNAIKRAKNLQK
tara:strand:- start:70 stop:426 length:357 start_codon:yes stop_codon:yes gene_type:complete